MRTIKFRGKDIKTGKWVYGYYAGKGVIIPFDKVNYDLGYINDSECHYCDPNTIGQFAGLTDKNGNEIYEGDIVKTKQFGKIHKEVNYAGYDIFEIQYINAQFMFFNEQRQFYLHRNTLCEIIGNIHDNPELINGNYKEEEL